MPKEEIKSRMKQMSTFTQKSGRGIFYNTSYTCEQTQQLKYPEQKPITRKLI